MVKYECPHIYETNLCHSGPRVYVCTLLLSMLSY